MGTPVSSPHRGENSETNRLVNSEALKVLPCNFSLKVPPLKEPVAGTSKQTGNEKTKKETPFMNFETSPKKRRGHCNLEEQRAKLRASIEILKKPLETEGSLEAVDADLGRMMLEDEEMRKRHEKEWKSVLRTKPSAAT